MALPLITLNLTRRPTRWRPEAPLDLRDLLDRLHLNPSRVVYECFRVTHFKPSAHELLELHRLEDGALVGVTRTPVSTEHWRHWHFRIEPGVPGQKPNERQSSFEVLN